jgi:hypothetical protein
LVFSILQIMIFLFIYSVSINLTRGRLTDCLLFFDLNLFLPSGQYVQYISYYMFFFFFLLLCE